MTYLSMCIHETLKILCFTYTEFTYKVLMYLFYCIIFHKVRFLFNYTFHIFSGTYNMVVVLNKVNLRRNRDYFNPKYKKL